MLYLSQSTFRGANKAALIINFDHQKLDAIKCSKLFIKENWVFTLKIYFSEGSATEFHSDVYMARESIKKILECNDRPDDQIREMLLNLNFDLCESED